MGRHQLILAAACIAALAAPAAAGSLPDAVYGQVTMTTAAVNIIIATTGTAYGQKDKTPQFQFNTNTLTKIPFPSFGASVLPNSAQSEIAMATAVKNIIIATTGTRFGQFAYPYSIVIAQAATPPAGPLLPVINNPIKGL